MRRKRKEKLTRKQKRIRTRVTFRTIFLLSITLIFNTYAWFLYATTVSTNLTAHVSAWHVEFEVNDEAVEREIDFFVTQAYPGMQEKTQNLTILNSGERPADITYEVKRVRILDDVFISSEEVAAGATVPQGAVVRTAAQLLTKITTEYPFHITITTTQASLGVNQSARLSIKFNWAYESGNDNTDTNFGVGAHNYYESHNGEPAIEAVIKVTVVQHDTGATPTPTPTVTPTPTTEP